MRRWRWYIAAGCVVVTGLLAAVALAGPDRAIDWTSVAPLSDAARQRANRQAAQRDAARLLGRVLLPPGATPSSGEPAEDGHGLGGAGVFPLETKHVDRHGWWTTTQPMSAVNAFLHSHIPAGAHIDSYGGGGAPPGLFVAYAFPSVGRVLVTRWLVVSMVGRAGGGTALRADAEVQWIVPRPRAERIPRSVRVLDVTVGPPHGAPSTRVSVVNRAKVARLVALINGLATSQPGAWNCPSWSVDAPVVTFTFRRVLGGRVLARAAELAAATEPTTPCDPMTLMIGGRQWTPLLGGAGVVRVAQHVLGVRLVRR
jgi:hypothetical protein